MQVMTQREACKEFCDSMNLHFDFVYKKALEKNVDMHKYLMELDSRTTIKGKLGIMDKIFNEFYMKPVSSA